jgi:hypothetical protein
MIDEWVLMLGWWIAPGSQNWFAMGGKADKMD